MNYLKQIGKLQKLYMAAQVCLERKTAKKIVKKVDKIDKKLRKST